MYHCIKCDRFFEKRHQYIGHCSVHSRKIKEKVPKRHICEHCGREFDQGVSLGGHIGRCKLSPNWETTHSRMIEENKTRIRIVTQETKNKISRSRLKYLEENPDKVPYLLNHSSKKSYPEQVFENALISSNITGWEYNFQNGIYQYDFAFLDLKIDVEIDGGTHLTEKVQKIDKRRDEFSERNGWYVLRFTAGEVKKDVISCINKLQEIILIRS